MHAIVFYAEDKGPDLGLEGGGQKMVVRSRLLKHFKLAYDRSPVNTGNTVWRRTKVSRQFAPEVRSFERSAVGSETHDPPLRGLKTESELKIARIETQCPEEP